MKASAMTLDLSMLNRERSRRGSVYQEAKDRVFVDQTAMSRRRQTLS
jgi:hypothetical protein